MKILAFGDIHIGKKHSNQFFLDLDQKTIKLIKQEVEKNNIDMVVFLGDLCHNRGEINQKAVAMVRYYAETLNNLGIPIKMILGNHDIYYNSKKSPNYLKTVIDGLFDNIHCIYDTYVENDILFVGWIQNEDELNNYNAISEKYKWIFGHFEFKGIELNDNYSSSFGYDNENRSSYIFSGHYHGRTAKNKVHYIGTPYPQTWSRKNDNQQGYCIIDTDKDEIIYKDLNLFKYLEQTMVNTLIEMDVNLKGFRNKIKGNEFRMVIDTFIEPKRLSELRMHINTMGSKNFMIENNLRFGKGAAADYDKIVLQSPKDFINDFIKKTTLEQSQKNRIMQKVSNILV